MRFLRFLSISFLCCALLVPLLFCFVQIKTAALPQTPAPTTPAPGTSAKAMALFDATSGTFLAESGASARLPMASTTKIMTALVVLEECQLDDTFAVPAEAVGVEGSSVYLFEGEAVSVRTLLYALLLSSANDAAVALALHTAGSVPAFAEKMNAKAAALGLHDTCFQNPHGLPAEGHYTTARELALIAAAAMKNPVFREIASTTRYSVPQNGTDATRLFLNHNRLLRTYNGAVGVKTGFTKESGRCLVGAAERDGLLLICVTLSDGNDWRDHTALFDWGFSQYSAFHTDTEPVEMPIVGGAEPSVSLVPTENIALTLPAGHGEITKTVFAPRFLFGSCREGQEVGKIVYRMDGEELASVPLVASKTVERAGGKPSLWQKIRALFGR